MDFKKALQVDSLEQLINVLREVFEKDEVDIEFVRELMTNYKSNPAEWRKYAVFDPHRYTRNLVDTGNGKYNLMLLCWSQGQGSAIHDHANSHCFMKILSGSLTEIRFDWPNYLKNDKKAAQVQNEDFIYEEMKVISEKSLNTNEVAYINDQIGLHRMENRSHSVPAVSLHLYTPPYSSCRTFDQRTGHTNEVKVTFTSKFGKRTPYKVKSSTENEKQVLRYENPDKHLINN